MKIVEKRSYDASASEIWSIIHDPANMPAWNPKCITCEPLKSADGDQWFAVTYEMKGRVTEASGELIESRPEALIHFRYHYEDASKVGVVDEVFEISARDSPSVELVHTIDFSRSALPFWVKVLIGIVGKIGKKMGEGPLDGINALLPESDSQTLAGEDNSP
jgi:uncharacterized protein YndB with AHSA1/START domain